MTEEHKRKISESHKARGILHWTKRPEVRKKMSEIRKKKPINYWLGKKRPEMCGKNNPRWSGGINYEDEKDRVSLEYQVWKLEVYKRDRGFCRLCKVRCTNKTIVAHHIKLFRDFPELRFSVDNGMTLCRSCHVKLHTPRKKLTFNY
jgi:hypothetical protein